MKTWESILISPEATILEAIRIIDHTDFLIALVVDEERRLIGTVTDGDIRRGILRNCTMDTPVKKIMFQTPLAASVNDSREKILSRLRKKTCRQIPLLDNNYRVVGIKTSNEFISSKLDIPVLIMAGGLGTRLRPLTDNCPKPLLHVGGKPILEIILDNFIAQEFNNFYISINYMGDMIEDYFEDGSKMGVNIQYLKENKRLGTAGAISLIDHPIDAPLIVMNGDLLTKVNFTQMMDFHKDNKSSATLCVREYNFQVPFGVVQMDNCKLKQFQEKPVQNYFINAGIYILEPGILQLIPKNEYFDMPDLLSKLKSSDNPPSVFPIREYWLDIGQMVDYHRAEKEYSEIKDNIILN